MYHHGHTAKGLGHAEIERNRSIVETSGSPQDKQTTVKKSDRQLAEGDKVDSYRL